MGKLTHTVSGSIASFKSADQAPINSLKIHFFPIQSGSGDPSPENIRPISGQNSCQVYHTGKNLLDPNTQIIKSTKSITYDIYAKQGYQYTVSAPSTMNYMLFSQEELTWYKENNTELHCTSSRNAISTIKYNQNDIDTNGHFQVELGDSVTAYEPYSGKVIPITFPASGKNLFNSELELGGISITDGSDVETNTRIRTKEVIPIIVSQTHTISASGMYSVTVYGYDENMVFIGANRNKVLPYTFTFTKPNIKYVRFSFSVDAAGSVTSLSAISNVQLEYGSIATTYEPFNNALYGGYIDLITGNIYNQYNKVIIDGSQTITEYYTSETYGIKTFSITKKNLYPDDSPAGNAQIYCDSLSKDADATSTITSETKLWDYWVNAMSYRFTFTAPYSYTPTTIAQYLSEHPITLVYKCADTLVATLNPIELKTLKGINNIWSNTNGDIECTYEFTDHMAKRRLELNTPHIETISDSFISFNTDLSTNAKDAKIYFNPIQNGEGDPSPSNIRNLVAWSNIKVRLLNDYIPIIPDSPQQIYYSSDNKYRMEYTTNGKFKLLDTIAAGDYPTFDINIVPTIYPEDGNRILAISNIKTSIGAWNLTFSLRDSDNVHKINGYFEFGNAAQALCVVINDTSTIRDVTYTLIKLIFSNAIPKDTEFILGITNSSNIISQDIDFSSTPLYGGYLDLTTGKLVQTHYKVTFDGTEVIANAFSAPGDKFIRIYFYSSDNNKILHAKRFANQRPETCVYSHGKYETSNTIDVSKGGAVINNSGTTTYIILHLPIELYVSDKLSTDIHNYLANQYNNGTPVEICYELNTPIEYQLTPQQIKTLKGTNNIWSNANGPVSIKYWTH